MIRLKHPNSYKQILNLYLASYIKGIQDSLGFWTVDSGFPVVDSSLCEWNLDSEFQSFVGFRIPRTVFRIPKPRFQIPQAKFSQIRESGFPSMGRYTPKQDYYRWTLFPVPYQ